MEGFEEELARRRKTGQGDKRQSSARSHSGAGRTSVEGGSGGGRRGAEGAEEVEEVEEGRIRLPSSKSHRCFLTVWRNCLVGKQAKSPERPKWPLLVETPGVRQEERLHIPTKEKEGRKKGRTPQRRAASVRE